MNARDSNEGSVVSEELIERAGERLMALMADEGDKNIALAAALGVLKIAGKNTSRSGACDESNGEVGRSDGDVRADAAERFTRGLGQRA